MSVDEKLSEKEFSQMIKLLHRYVNTEMDQWELWSFDTAKYSKIYIQISLGTTYSDEAYISLNKIIEQPD